VACFGSKASLKHEYTHVLASEPGLAPVDGAYIRGFRPLVSLVDIGGARTLLMRSSRRNMTVSSSKHGI
jgi:hypothetical protein